VPVGLCVGLEGHEVSVRILPKVGANLVSFQVDGRECIYVDEDALLANGESLTGAFQMFPTPCRLADARYLFQGREIVQRKRGEEVAIHGLVRDEEFQVEQTPHALICALVITRDHPVHEGFPFPGRLTTTYRPIGRGLEVSFAFENRGPSPAPVGYGLHPYWRILADRSRVQVKIPAEYLAELRDLLPTGKLLPVAGTSYDWREFRSLEGVDIDAVFFPKKAADAAAIRFLEEGLQVTLQSSPNLRHMICYAPAGQPFVCLENLSCAPNAPNLYAAGFEELSGLAVVMPGETWSGWIRYVVDNLQVVCCG
jgi:aldose 1-epimerase